MPITHRIGNIFDQEDVNVIIHQANLYHTFGAGIAAQIAMTHPEAYAADKVTVYGDENKLGKFSYARVDDEKKIIVNLYSQQGVGGLKRNTVYDALCDGMSRIKGSLAGKKPMSGMVGERYILGVPYGIASGLAGGSWKIVYAILQSVFDDDQIELVVCKRPQDPELTN